MSPKFVPVNDVPLRQKPSLYPAPFAARMEGRQKKALGEIFGLQNFGVNHTTLAPGAQSALRHAHAVQDEFIYILEGVASLIDDDGEQRLPAGSCVGFRAGTGNAHQLCNRGSTPVVYLEIGDRKSGDQVTYPDDDLAAKLVNGSWQFTHKDGEPY